jgi:hypothetical protein
VPIFWLASLPAAYGIVQFVQLLCRWSGGWIRGGLVITASIVTILAAMSHRLADLGHHCLATTPLSIGLTPQAQEAIRGLENETTSDSRILVEEFSKEISSSHWTPLLAFYTGRVFIGGLISAGAIEHGSANLIDQHLCGKLMTSWSDAELELFCRRYNVSWAFCRSRSTLNRLRKFPGYEDAVQLTENNDWHLVRLKPRSFFIRGQGRVLRTDFRHIALADLVPEDGTVVLSMHYQPGLQASPARVQIEKEPDAQDPVPFIRLRVSGPVARVILTWNEP